MLASRGCKIIVNDPGIAFDGSGSASQQIADEVVEEIRLQGGQAVASYDSVEDGAALVNNGLEAVFGRNPHWLFEAAQIYHVMGEEKAARHVLSEIEGYMATIKPTPSNQRLIRKVQRLTAALETGCPSSIGDKYLLLISSEPRRPKYCSESNYRLAQTIPSSKFWLLDEVTTVMMLTL